MTGRGRVTKYLVRRSLYSIAAIVGAQIYTVREVLAILLMLWLSFLVLWIGLSTFSVLCERSWRGVNSPAAHVRPILIRWQHVIARVAVGVDSGHAPT
jgi:hypothetical protein